MTLGCLRSLQAAGRTAYCATPQLPFVRASRYFRRLPGGAPLLEEPARLGSWLAELDLPGAVLLPCSDEAALACAALPESLAHRFPASVAGNATLRQLVDKAGLERLCAELDVPRARTWLLASADDLPPAGAVDYRECFLKPLQSQAFCRRHGIKALPVSSRADALARYRRCREEGFEMLLQRYVPGPASHHYFIDGVRDRSGRLAAMIARRRLRMFPLDFGNSTYMRSVPLDEVADAAAALRRLLDHVAYRGIFSAEFKRDDETGQLRLIEVNPRAWAFIEFSLLCGVNIAELAVRDALGQRMPAPAAPREGLTMRMMPLDLLAVAHAVRHDELTWRRALGQWVRARSSLFSSRDPLPWVVQRAGDLGGYLGRRLPWRRARARRDGP